MASSEMSVIQDVEDADMQCTRRGLRFRRAVAVRPVGNSPFSGSTALLERERGVGGRGRADAQAAGSR
jgi:hypothetical protein